jgi:hypothetical protein
MNQLQSIGVSSFEQELCISPVSNQDIPKQTLQLAMFFKNLQSLAAGVSDELFPQKGIDNGHRQKQIAALLDILHTKRSAIQIQLDKNDGKNLVRYTLSFK